MTGGELLRRQKDLCAWWTSVVHDDRFEHVLALARADLCVEAKGDSYLQGANSALNLLSTIAENPAGMQPLPTAGLDHRTPEQIMQASRLDEEGT